MLIVEMSCSLTIVYCSCFSNLCFDFLTHSLSIYVVLSNLTFTAHFFLLFLWTFLTLLSSSLYSLCVCLALIIHFLPSTPPTIISTSHFPPTTHSPLFPPLLACPSTIIRCPPARPGWISGAWVSTPRKRLLGQASAARAAVWVVQPSQLTAAFQRLGFHCLRHPVHGAGKPGGLLEWLPEWSSAGGPEGRLHHRLTEDGSRHGGRLPADQCGPGWLWGGPKATGSQERALIR